MALCFAFNRQHTGSTVTYSSSVGRLCGCAYSQRAQGFTGAIAEAALDATYLGQQPVVCTAMYTVGLLGAGAVVVLPRLRENKSNR